MSYRAFRDQQGREWEVWEVIPAAVERRERDTPESVPVERRRHSGEHRIRVSAEMRAGWLAFQSRHERRRFGPTPEGWVDMSDAELEELLRKAVLTGSARRLIE
jgi:hypothetical protein